MSGAAEKKPAAAKKKPPQKLHIDKRADALAAGPGDDDELLSTVQEAAWLGVSTIWLEISRLTGIGPPFQKLGPRMVRYRRGDTRAWLRERTFKSTAEYEKPRKRV